MKNTFEFLIAETEEFLIIEDRQLAGDPLIIIREKATGSNVLFEENGVAKILGYLDLEEFNDDEEMREAILENYSAIKERTGSYPLREIQLKDRVIKVLTLDENMFKIAADQERINPSLLQVIADMMREAESFIKENPNIKEITNDGGVKTIFANLPSGQNYIRVIREEESLIHKCELIGTEKSVDYCVHTLSAKNNSEITYEMAIPLMSHISIMQLPGIGIVDFCLWFEKNFDRGISDKMFGNYIVFLDNDRDLTVSFMLLPEEDS